jgi:hypothetical protein
VSLKLKVVHAMMILVIPCISEIIRQEYSAVLKVSNNNDNDDEGGIGDSVVVQVVAILCIVG